MLVAGVQLLAVPDLDAGGGALDDAVHRLHGRVGEIGKIVTGLDDPAAPAKAASVALLAGDEAGRFGGFAVAGEDVLAAELEGSAFVPFDAQRVAALLALQVSFASTATPEEWRPRRQHL